MDKDSKTIGGSKMMGRAEIDEARDKELMEQIAEALFERAYPSLILNQMDKTVITAYLNKASAVVPIVNSQVQAERERAKEIIRSLLPIADGKCIYCNRGDKRDENNIHLILNGEDVMCLEHEFYEEAREYLEGGD